MKLLKYAKISITSIISYILSGEFFVIISVKLDTWR